MVLEIEFSAIFFLVINSVFFCTIFSSLWVISEKNVILYLDNTCRFPFYLNSVINILNRIINNIVEWVSK